jgi:hypothetical protein
MVEVRNAYKASVGSVFWEEATLLFYGLGVDGRITSNNVFKKQVVRMWNFLAHGAVHWTTLSNLQVQLSPSPPAPEKGAE